ncbi:hypothetical protein BGZ82_001125 [Podila clonocystis]|nr:hypothetical protein BGZ82_001125 [Podila clonocystis]
MTSSLDTCKVNLTTCTGTLGTTTTNLNNCTQTLTNKTQTLQVCTADNSACQINLAHNVTALATCERLRKLYLGAEGIGHIGQLNVATRYCLTHDGDNVSNGTISRCTHARNRFKSKIGIRPRFKEVD